MRFLSFFSFIISNFLIIIILFQSELNETYLFRILQQKSYCILFQYDSLFCHDCKNKSINNYLRFISYFIHKYVKNNHVNIFIVNDVIYSKYPLFWYQILKENTKSINDNWLYCHGKMFFKSSFVLIIRFKINMIWYN